MEKRKYVARKWQKHIQKYNYYNEIRINPEMNRIRMAVDVRDKKAIYHEIQLYIVVSVRKLTTPKYKVRFIQLEL